MRSLRETGNGKAPIALAACLAISLAGAPPARAEQPAAEPAHADTVAWLRHVADGVQKLRLEIAELRFDMQERRTAELERDLLAAQAERERLDREAATHLEEAASLDRQLTEPGLSPEQQHELLAHKTALLAEITGRLRAKQDHAARTESTAHERLENQRRLLRESTARRNGAVPQTAPASQQ
jgi:hypothetical protein